MLPSASSGLASASSARSRSSACVSSWPCSWSFSLSLSPASSSFQEVKNELLDLSLVGRTHFSFCEDLLQPFNFDNFGAKKFALVDYHARHSERLARTVASPPGFPFTVPHVVEMR